MSCFQNANIKLASRFIKITVALALTAGLNVNAQPNAAKPTQEPIIGGNLHGDLHYHIYTTRIAINLPHGREDYYVYTPPGYNPKSSTKYPVLYLLHGDLQNASWWTTSGYADVILDNLIARGKARPMIVVMPLGYGNYQFGRDGFLKWGNPSLIDRNVDLFSGVLLEEIIPQVESAYNVSKRREDRAIAGLSMGGREAIITGLRNPDKFAWVGGFSSAFPFIRRSEVIAIKPEVKNLKLLWLACAVSDGYVFKGNMRLSADLNQQGAHVTTVVTHGGHDFPVWRDDLRQFAPLIFQPE